MNEQFGYATRMLERDELHRDWCDEREAAGALYEAEGVGIHPLKFTYGLAARARALGVRLHTASPVQGWRRARRRAPPAHAGRHGARAPRRGLHRRLHRPAPEPVAEEPADADPVELGRHAGADRGRAGRPCNLRSQTFMTDTRTLRFYYRLLKDNRLQIGSRSSVTGADAGRPGRTRSCSPTRSRASSRRSPASRSTTRGGAGSTSATT